MGMLVLHWLGTLDVVACVSISQVTTCTEMRHDDERQDSKRLAWLNAADVVACLYKQYPGLLPGRLHGYLLDKQTP